MKRLFTIKDEFIVMPADEVLLRFGAAAYGMTCRVRNVTSGFYEGVIVNEADCVIDEPCELVAFYVEVETDDDFMLVGVMRDWLVGIDFGREILRGLEAAKQETELVAQIPEIRAEAGRAGFLACIRLAHELQHPPGTIHADHYAEKVRNGGEA